MWHLYQWGSLLYISQTMSDDVLSVNIIKSSNNKQELIIKGEFVSKKSGLNLIVRDN